MGETMKKLTIIITLVLMSLLISCKDNPVDPPDVEINGSTYSNKILGFRISAPEGWELRENVQIGQYKSILEGRKIEFNGKQPSFNIIQEGIQGEIDAITLMNMAEQNLPMMFPSLEFDSKNVVNVGGFECAELVFHHTYQGEDLKQKQLMFCCQPNKLLVITFDSSADRYQQDDEEYDFIKNSIEKL